MGIVKNFAVGVDVGLMYDFGGNPVPIDGNKDGNAQPDIGAYEYVIEEEECDNPHPADLDNNCCIDNDEIVLFVDEWQSEGSEILISELMQAIRIWKQCS